MKKLLLLLIIPFLSFGQGPSFTVRDQNENIWNSDTLLATGTTIIIDFFSPGENCWPSQNHVHTLKEAFSAFSECNDLFFLQVAQWGYNFEVEEFLEEFGDTSIPWIPGYNLADPFISGYDLTGEFVEYGLQWAYECWILRPDGSYEIDLYGMSAEPGTTNYLISFLEDDGFTNCAENLSIEEVIGPKVLLKTVDVLGRETTNKGLQLHIYDDGTVEKKYRF